MKRAALAALSGAALAAAFPAPDLGWLAWAAFAPLIVLGLTGSSAVRCTLEGFLFGLVLHGIVFAWWYQLLVRYGGLSHPTASGVFLLMVGYQACYPALFAGGLRILVLRRGPTWALAIAPLLWGGLELIRGRAFTGLPWAVLGASQHEAPIVLQAAALGGVTLVSVVVASGNAVLAGLWLAWRARKGAAAVRPEPRAIVALLAVVILALGYGASGLLREAPEGAGTFRVALVQGNIPQDEKWSPSARMRILDAHMEATRRGAEEGARLVVWPESSVPLPLTSAPVYRSMLEALAAETGVDLLVGSVHYESHGDRTERIYNSAFLLRPASGPARAQRYDKIHLVPFGEYVPLRRWMGPVGTLVEEAGDFSPGAAPVVMRSGPARLAPLICYEAIFPELTRRFVREGAEILVNMTNDGFLGDTAGPRQHLALAAIRTVESGRWMLRAANTGISAVVDSNGRIRDSAAYGTKAVLVADVPLHDHRTLYTQLGDVPGWACVILALASLIAPGIPKGR